LSIITITSDPAFEVLDSPGASIVACNFIAARTVEPLKALRVAPISINPKSVGKLQGVLEEGI
jgi:hypothetical protein